MNINSYLKYIHEDISIPSNINIHGDTFKLDGGAETEKEWKELLNFLKSHYNEAKNKTMNSLKGIHEENDYGWMEVNGVKSLKGHRIELEDRYGPYFQIEWELVPYGIVYKKSGKKVKVKYIVTELLNGEYNITVALPYNFWEK